MTTIKTYRFKFDENISSILNDFGKLHINEDRKDYNQHWELWILENNDIIQREENRLLECGYNGNIYDKLYKSARYYHRKKKCLHCQEKEKRREYIPVSNEFLEAIDFHINTIVKDTLLSPANGYDDFCQKNKILLSIEVIKLMDENEFTKDYISSKLKKTYKNRYFYKLKSVK